MTTRPDQHLLGICLGMQMMTLAEKGSVATYAPPLHGKTSFLQSENPQIDGRKVARYHSMICQAPESKFELIATADGHPMWIQHKTKLWLGLQFHPESFLTENSDFYLNALADWIRQ
jgi:anthranilate/para-aminobenzoate synthase component II